MLVKPVGVRPKSESLSNVELLSLTDIELVEHLAARFAGIVIKAHAVADRSEFLPCLDHWATRERLARLDDVIFNGRRMLRRVSAA